MIGNHLIAHWSKTQATIALSSGEAELNATLKGGAEGLYLKHLWGDCGFSGSVRIHTDSGATVGTVQRQGAGRIKHLETRQMWIQEKISV